MGNVDDHGPVRPAPVVVLMGLPQFEPVELGPDLLAEFPQRPVEGFLAEIQRTAGNGPGPTAVAVEGASGQEVPRAVLIHVADQHAGGAVPAPPHRPVGQRDEPVARSGEVHGDRSWSRSWARLGYGHGLASVLHWPA